MMQKLKLLHASQRAKFKTSYFRYVTIITINPNALTQHDMDIETGEDGIPNTFVPARNLLFLSFAGALAYQRNAKHIITGVCETDFSGYPDCRDSFIKSMNVTLSLSMDKDFVIHTPLMWLDKAQTWELSDELGVLDYIRHNTLHAITV